VKVRLLFDRIGTARIPGYRDMIKKLQQTAIEWHPLLPIQPLKGKRRRPELRNHRKIVVVDGRVGFIGSLNMIDACYHNRRHGAADRWESAKSTTSNVRLRRCNSALITADHFWQPELGEQRGIEEDTNV
jgi:phosphatidylserine/phosphatidylglycerophosphate/cardiolipin synthase-like enzyme